MPEPSRRVPLRLGQVDVATGVVELASGERRRLTSVERALLAHLVSHAGRDVPRTELLEQVWGMSDRVLSRAADDAARRLRAKIEVEPSQPDHVLAVHGVGYRFVPLAPETPPAPAPEPSPALQLDGVEVDLDRARVRRGEVEEALTSNEVALLRYLVPRAGRPVSKPELLRALWGRSPARAGRVLENTVLRLRAKLEPDPSAPRNLVTQRGAGYVLNLPGDPEAPDDRVGAVLAALERARLVAVVGPPGVGTSTVAAQALHLRTAAHPAAGVRVDLSGATDPEARVGAVDAGVLLLDDADEAMDALRAWLPAFLDRRADVRVLVAARQPTGIEGEQVVAVAPLPLDEAAALLERLSPVPLDPDDARALAQALDGLPLALQLAASRLRVVPAGELLSRLSALGTAAPGVPARQRSLEAALDVSWGVLGPEVHEVATRLAVRPAAFDLALAEEVGGPGALDALEALERHSLLAVQGGRYRLLSTVRLDLLARGAPAALDEARAAWREALEARAVALLANIPAPMLGREGAERLHPDREAWWALCDAEPAPPSEVFVLVCRGLFEATPSERMLRMLERGLQAAMGESRAVLLRTRALLRLMQLGDAAGGLADAEAALAVGGAPPWLDARIRDSQAWGLLLTGRPAEAEAALREGLARCREQDASILLSSLGAVLRRSGRVGEAIEAYEEALVRQVPDTDFEPGVAWLNLALATWAVGERQRALARIGVALDHLQHAAHARAAARENQAAMLATLGRLDEASEALDLAEADARAAGWSVGLVWVQCGRCRLHLLRGDAAAGLRAIRAAPPAGDAVRIEVEVHRGLALVALGRLDEARIVSERVRRVFGRPLAEHRQLAVLAAAIDEGGAPPAELARRLLAAG